MTCCATRTCIRFQRVAAERFIQQSPRTSPCLGNDSQQGVVKRPSIGINMGLLFLKRGAVHGCRCRQGGWRAVPWNKGKLLGQKPPLTLKETLAIRVRLQLAKQARDLGLFNRVIDSKLRGCDLVGLRVHDVVHGSRVAAWAIVMQKKTERPVQFEITEQTRDAIAAGITAAHLKPEQFPFSESRVGVAASFDLRVFPDCRVLG